MNSRRKAVWAALPVLVGLLFLGGFGTVETTLWLLLVAVWLWALLSWSKESTA